MPSQEASSIAAEPLPIGRREGSLLSRILTAYVANPYLFGRGSWFIVRFGPLTGIAFIIGSTLTLLPALSILGPGQTYTFLVRNLLLYPPVILICSVFRFRLFNVPYWIRTFREIRNGTWHRPPAVLYGGLLPAAALTCILGVIASIDILTVTDIIAPAAMIGIACARFGCLNYGCCFGYPSRDDAKVYVRYVHPYSWPNRLDPPNAGRPRIPIQIAEIAGGFVLAIPLAWTEYFGHTRGLPSALFFLLYGTFRFCTEFFRQPEEAKIFHVTLWQWVSMACIVLGLICLAFVTQRPAYTFHPIDMQTALRTIPAVLLLGFVELSFGFGFHRH